MNPREPNRKAGALLPSSVWVGCATRSRAHKDTTLPDTFIIEQPGIDVTGFLLQLVQMFQASEALQVSRE
ncbi:hypothetical protein GCM10017710_26990 [Arthrobacter ramosus]